MKDMTTQFLTPAQSGPFDFFSEGAKLESDSINLLGFEFDGTACFRKGTRLGPDAIRKDSTGIESYSPYLDLDLEDYKGLTDLGNLPIGSGIDQTANWKVGTDAFFQLTSQINLKDENIKIITLGGEHSISYAPIKKYLEHFNDLVLVHLDAHADLRDGYEGHHYSHASIIRRVLDHWGKDHQLIQYGIRSGTKEEYKWMRENKTNRKSLADFIESIESIESKKPIYLTLDLDNNHPSYLPRTGTPEAGGETFHSFIKLCKVLRKKNLVGADVVELAPNIDPTGNSTVFAAKVVRELVLILGEANQ
jgi:agmatinase